MESWKDFPELLPPGGHKDLGKRVFTLLGEVISDKINKGLHSKWIHHYKLRRNQFWKQNSTAVPLVSANLIHTHQTRTRNILTDNNPTFNLAQLSAEVEDQQIQKLQNICSYWWTEQEQQILYERSVDNGETYGVAIEKSIFNPHLEYGLGEVETVVVDPFQFGFYPVDCLYLQKADALFHFYPMSVREARRRWPGSAEFIVPDDEWLEELGSERQEIVSGGQSHGSMWIKIGGFVKSLLNISGSTESEGDKTLVCECWAKDYTLENGAPKYKGYIRCVTVCSGGRVVLDDRSNPSVNPEMPDEDSLKTYLYDKFPFSLANSYTDNQTAWGMSDIEQLEQLNREFNKAMSQMIFLKDKSARPKILNPLTSGVPNSEFTNAPGVINPSNVAEAQAIRYMDFPNVPFDIEKIVALLKELFFLVAGSFELEQSQAPSSKVIAYKAIAALLERAATMMRGKIRNYSSLIRERGRMYLSHVQNWYTEERFFTREEDGKTIPDTISAAEVRFPVRLTVVNGSTLPVSKVQQREEAIVLYEKGAIDQQDLLEKLDWNNRGRVLERAMAGPFKVFMDRMAAMGAPEELLGIIQELSNMQDKDFEKAVKQGEVPLLEWPGQPEDTQTSKQNLEVQELQEKVRREQAERALVEEKANTERVKQRVDEAGIEFDRQKLNIERAQVLAEIKFQKENPPGNDKPYVKNADEHNRAREKGLKSNNLKQ